MWEMGTVKEEGRKQRERKRDQISQTDGQLSIRTTLQQRGSAGHHPALSPGGPGARLHPGVLAPTGPNPMPLTRLSQEAQTGQMSLAGDAQTVSIRPTPQGRRQAWLGHYVMAHDCHRASLSPPRAAKGQNKGQHLEPRGSPAPEGAQHPAPHGSGTGAAPKRHPAPRTDPKSWGMWGTQCAQDRPWHSIWIQLILREV